MRGRASSYALATPLALFLLAMLVMPLWVLLAQSLSGAGLWETWRNSYYLSKLGWTFLQASVSTLLCALLGVPAAATFARYEFRGRNLLEALLGLPFVVPVIVAGMGFLVWFGARGALFDLTQTPWLVLLANLFYNYGVIVRSVWASLEVMDRDLEGVARLDGANSWQVFRFVTLPFALPAAQSAMSLVFLYCFASFGVPLLLGGERYTTLEVEIYQSVQNLELTTAGGLALAQLIVTLAVTLLYTAAQARASLPQDFHVSRHPARGWGRIWLGAHIGFALVLTLLPLGAVLWRSVWDHGFTLSHYLNLFQTTNTVFSSDLQSALLNNLRFVALALAIAVPLGTTQALAVWQSGSRWLEAISLLPLMISATLLGVAYIATYSAFAASLWLLIAAYAMSAYPFITRAVLTGLRALDPRLLEAARVDGANRYALLRFIALPLLASSLRNGIGFAFAVVIGEFAATLVLQRPEWATLSTLIYQHLGRPGQLGEASALATLLLLTTMTGFWVIARPNRF